MKNSGSNLTTIVGIIILLLFLLAAAYFRIPALEGFLILLILLCLVARLWGRYALSRISLKIEEWTLRLFPGQKGSLHFRLQNRKFLPVIWLDIDCAGSNTKIMKTARGKGLSSELTWIMPHQDVSWDEIITGSSRGILRVQKVMLRSGDGFGLFQKNLELSLEKPIRVVVFPRIIPADTGQVLRQMKEMEASLNGFYKDRTLVKQTGAYTGRENYRDINWRHLAKSGEEIINIYENQAMRRASFIPDLESFVRTDKIEENGQVRIVRKLEADEMEEMLSLIASLIVGLENRDVVLSLLLPAIGDAPAESCIPESKEQQTGQLLEELAGINYCCEQTKVPLALAEEQLHLLGQIYIVTRTAAEQTLFFPEEIGAKVLKSHETVS